MQPTTHLSRACIEHGWSAVNVDDSRRAACGGKARIGQDGHGKRCSERRVHLTAHACNGAEAREPGEHQRQVCPQW